MEPTVLYGEIFQLVRIEPFQGLPVGLVAMRYTIYHGVVSVARNVNCCAPITHDGLLTVIVSIEYLVFREAIIFLKYFHDRLIRRHKYLLLTFSDSNEIWFVHIPDKIKNKPTDGLVHL